MPPIRHNRSQGLLCNKVVQILPDYLDRQLDTTVDAMVGEHLLSCDYCTSVMQGHINAETALRTAAQNISVPSDLHAQFRMRLAQQQSRSRSSWQRPMILAPLFAAGLIIWIVSHHTNMPAEDYNAPKSTGKAPTQVTLLTQNESNRPSIRNMEKSSPVVASKVIKDGQPQPHYRKPGIEVTLNRPETTFSFKRSYQSSAMNHHELPVVSKVADLSDTSTTPEVDLIVHDEDRGFTASTRIARLEGSNGDSEVLRFADIEESTKPASKPERTE